MSLRTSRSSRHPLHSRTDPDPTFSLHSIQGDVSTKASVKEFYSKVADKEDHASLSPSRCGAYLLEHPY